MKAPAKTITLNAGRDCVLKQVSVSFLPGYFVLVFPHGEPSLEEEQELFKVALANGRAISTARVGHSDRFTVIYSGHASRRVLGWHLHIVILPGRWSKAWLYFLLSGKNILQALRWRRSHAAQQGVQADRP